MLVNWTQVINFEKVIWLKFTKILFSIGSGGCIFFFVFVFLVMVRGENTKDYFRSDPIKIFFFSVLIHKQEIINAGYLHFQLTFWNMAMVCLATQKIDICNNYLSSTSIISMNIWKFFYNVTMMGRKTISQREKFFNTEPEPHFSMTRKKLALWLKKMGTIEQGNACGFAMVFILHLAWATQKIMLIEWKLLI